MAEGAEMPDLIIADGGKGQMGVIHEVLERLGLDIPIAGLAKDDRHRTAELLCGFPPVLVGIRPTSPLFHFLAHIQEEVHRFAVSFQGVYPQRTGADRGGRGQDGPDPAAPFPHGGKGPCGQHRRTFGAGRGGKGEKNQGLFRKIAVFFEKLRKSPIFVHPIRRVTLAEMPGWRNR